MESREKNRAGLAEFETAETVLRVRIPAPLVHTLKELLQEESFGFTSLEHVILSGLWSFAGFKKRQLERLRADSESRGSRPW